MYLQLEMFAGKPSPVTSRRSRRRRIGLRKKFGGFLSHRQWKRTVFYNGESCNLPYIFTADILLIRIIIVTFCVM
jgi:hypothetical protein